MSFRTLIANVRVFDGVRLTDPRSIYIDGPLIGDPSCTHSSADVITIDGSGFTLLPGFIDTHVHLSEPDRLLKHARHGVTTAIDMASISLSDVIAMRDARTPGVADVRTAGMPACAPEAPQARMMSLPDDAQISTPEGAREFVRLRVKEGSDYLKVFVEPVGPSKEVLGALVEAANKRQKRVVAHGLEVGPYKVAMKSDAHVLTHVPLDAPLSRLDVAKMEAADGRPQVAVPTLIAMKTIINGSHSKPHWSYDNASASIRVLHEAGVPIVAGTDSVERSEWASNADAFRVPHGAGLHDELALLVDAGLSPAEALRSATIVAAECFGLHDRGAVQPGLRADMVLVRGNPLEDINLTRGIEAVWCNGVRVALAGENDKAS